MLSNEKGNENCQKCGALRDSLHATGRKYYDDLMKIEQSETQCQSMVYNVMLNILVNNTLGLQHQLRPLAACGNFELNYKLTMMKLKMDEIGEAEGINYYRTWIEEDIWNLVPWRKKWLLYHNVNKSWIWPTVATIMGLSPIVFRYGFKNLDNRVGNFRKNPSTEVDSS